MALRVLPFPCWRKGMAIPGRGGVRAGQTVHLSEQGEETDRSCLQGHCEGGGR